MQCETASSTLALTPLSLPPPPLPTPPACFPTESVQPATPFCVDAMHCEAASSTLALALCRRPNTGVIQGEPFDALAFGSSRYSSIRCSSAAWWPVFITPSLIRSVSSILHSAAPSTFFLRKSGAYWARPCFSSMPPISLTLSVFIFAGVLAAHGSSRGARTQSPNPPKRPFRYTRLRCERLTSHCLLNLGLENVRVRFTDSKRALLAIFFAHVVGVLRWRHPPWSYAGLARRRAP